MSADNSSIISERKELQIRSKTMYRREPSLSPNVTLLIECGTVILVMTIVGLIFYCSQRNFKKRSNIHRRRWLESDANIESYSDGEIYGTRATLEESQSQPMDLDQVDCPPPYDSVVLQSKILSHKNRHSVRNNSQIHKNSDEFDKNLPKRHSNFDVTNSNTIRAKNTSDPLIPSCASICIVAENDEIASLIQSGDLASSFSLDRQNYYTDEECTIRRKGSIDGLNVDVHSSKNSQSVRTGEHTDKNVNADPRKTVDSENEGVILDASGLPSYDAAIKIQEGGFDTCTK